MTAVISTTCARCGAELRDRTSRLFGIGPECRKTMTDAQLRAAIDRNTPGHTPPAVVRPASAEAHRNHTEVTRVTAPEPEAKLCAAHGGIPRSCALCRRDNDPKLIADRVIALVQRMPMAERLAAQRAAAIRRYHPATTHQLTIGEPT